MQGAFAGCANLHVNAIDAPNLSNVIDMQFMFGGASSMNEDISGWDVSDIEYMDGLFQKCKLTSILTSAHGMLEMLA